MWAHSVDSKQYLPSIQQNIVQFLKDTYGHNTIDPRRGFDLDMTLAEVVQVQENIAFLRERAANGQL